MRKYNAIIIDDEKENVKLLSYLLEKYCSSEINIVGTATTKNAGILLIKKHKPDVLFLDILLDEGTSFDLLDEIDYVNYRIVFVSAHKEYAVKAFKYFAIDYILKPIVIDEIVNVVRKISSNTTQRVLLNKQNLKIISNNILHDNQQLTKITIPSKNKVDFVEKETILFFKADKNTTEVYLKDGSKIESIKSIGDYEALFVNDNFFRIHKSYLVNLNNIHKIVKGDGSYCQVIDGTTIPISPAKKELLYKIIKATS